MKLQIVLSLIPLISTAYAGVFIQGFSDRSAQPNGIVGCQTGLGSVTISQNGVCVDFPTEWNGIQVAGGGGSGCFLRVFAFRGCQDESDTNVGPINDPNLGGCIGPFPFSGEITGPRAIQSGQLVNCPT